MANPEHLAKLMEGVEAWGQWRKQNPEVEPFLTLANLDKADLREANLSGADLRQANLNSADLRRANLRRADLSAAILRMADLSRADLRWANRLCELSAKRPPGDFRSEQQISRFRSDRSPAPPRWRSLPGFTSARVQTASRRASNLFHANSSGSTECRSRASIH